MMRNQIFKATTVHNLILAVSILLFAHCKKEGIADIQPENLSEEVKLSAKGNMLAATGVISTSYYIEKALPVGYVKNGTVDYTSYIQTAINNNSNLVFPAFPILINDKGLNIGSNKVIRNCKWIRR